MSKRLAILGASGHGRVIADIARASGWLVIDFFDDKFPGQSRVGKVELVGNIADAMGQHESYDGYALGIGNNEIRKNVFNQLVDRDLSTPTIVHPTACISPSVSLGSGTVVMPFACVNADATVGDGVIINTHATIEHDCKLEHFSHISPNAALAGGVVIGECAWIGIGASVKQLVTIGANTLIGAGAAVVKDVTANSTVVGVPGITKVAK